MRRSEAYLLDMLIHARKAVEFASGLTYERFTLSDLHQNAILRSIEIIGEAASHVNPETREVHSEIPWHEIIGMRNRLVHGYFEVNFIRVWDTVTQDLPALIAQLEPLFPTDD